MSVFHFNLSFYFERRERKTHLDRKKIKEAHILISKENIKIEYCPLLQSIDKSNKN